MQSIMVFLGDLKVIETWKVGKKGRIVDKSNVFFR
jgi:hypothetical protein